MSDTNKAIEPESNQPEDNENVETTEKVETTKKTSASGKAKAAATKPVEPKKAEKSEVKKSKVDLFNVLGEKVDSDDYFFGGVIPAGFEKTCGKPVDREDLLAVFNKIFNPSDNILFYRQPDKEVYLVIVPIKYSTSIGGFNNSVEGDFQKHAISFLNEGSVNVDTLRGKLEKVVKYVKYNDR